MSKSFLTHTFSECVENHQGMQKIGDKRERGFEEQTLEGIAARFPGMASVVKLACEGVQASVLVLKGGVDYLLGAGGKEKLLAESLAQPFDTHFLNVRRKVIQAKHGRLNNCYAEEAQAPDLAVGKGTVIAFDAAPLMNELRGKLPEVLGEEARGLFAETNFYPDVTKSKVGIGFHGDTERCVVVGVRLGKGQMSLRFQWYRNSLPISEEIPIELQEGDIYVMSHKATGQDWMCPSKVTLRHGTGRKAVPRAVGEAKKGAKRKLEA